MSDSREPLGRLLSLVHPDGGWSYRPGLQPHLEPTCLALLALSADPATHAEALTKAKQWLQKCVLSDGSYRLPNGRFEAVWTTALTLFTLVNAGESPARLEATTRVLLAIEGRTHISDDQDISDIDGSIKGWPWGLGTFSWVEPTAMACLALRRVGQGDHPRVADAHRLLLDRILESGGLNYGNRRIFAIDLEAIPSPSALALLALQGTHIQDSRIHKTLEYLQQVAGESENVEHLAWSILALDAWRASDAPSPLLDQLRQRLIHAVQMRQDTPYLSEAPHLLALAALALDTPRRNPFRLGAATQNKPLAASSLFQPQKGLGQKIKGFFQNIAIQTSSQLRPLPPRSDVFIASVSDYNADLVDVLSRQYEHFRATVPLAGKRVVLKPNLVEYHRDKVINTHPHVVAAVIELCQRENAAEVIVAEGPGHWRNVEYLVQASGLGAVIRHHKVRFVDLNHDEPVKRINPSRLTRLEHLYLSHTIATADVVISLPKLKTHHWAGATLSLKNLFGTLPGICYGWPKNELHWRGIDNSIVDIAVTRTPELAIVDGIVGMEGDGPLNGTPKAVGVLVMGADLVAVDATCCRLMQLDPTKIPYMIMGSKKRLGHVQESSIAQVGETIDAKKQPFDTVASFQKLWIGRRA